jgi:acyl-CoA thioesterase
VSEFEGATAITPRVVDGDGDGDRRTYDVALDPGWAILGKPNGGYLLAILGRAACDTVGTAHPLAISGHYIRAPKAGPAEIRTEAIRRGRRASTARAALWQDSKACIEALVTSGELASYDSEYTATPPPAMPPPEQCIAPGTEKFHPEIFEHCELWLDPATAPFPTPSGEARMRFWFRLRDGSEHTVLALILATDIGPPTIFNLTRFGWAPTVELTVLLRGVPASGWLRCETTCQLMAGGWFDENAAIWDSAGRLVAQSRQLALVGERPPKPPA